MPELDRRQFIQIAGSSAITAAPAVSAAAASAVEGWDPAKPLVRLGRELTIQPVFMYRIPQKREQTSWKSWGGVQTEEAAKREMAHINAELRALPVPANLSLRFLPVIAVTTPEQAARVHEGAHDLVIVYACTGSGQTLKACFSPKDTIVFLRQRSGPVYYWYEALSSRYLASGDAAGPGVVHVDDVVVDSPQELISKLRGWAAATHLRGSRIVALGGAAGKYAGDAPQIARDRFKLDIVDISYDEFSPRMKAARADTAMLRKAQEQAKRYLAMPGTTLRTNVEFVTNAFVLYALFMDLLREHDSTAFTIKDCMSTVIPMSATTACLPLSLMNDQGLISLCESDFVIIPPAMLMRYVSGNPVFLHNSTFPHRRMVTCAHCTAPRRTNGKDYYPATVVTHYESDYGAAPKVDMPIGREVSFIDPEFTTGRWLGFKGVVRENPFYEICRSQQNVEIAGDWEALKGETRDSHWVMAEGDLLEEAGYAARKLGLKWRNLSRKA
jgi:L-fucose isomerase-like protein